MADQAGTAGQRQRRFGWSYAAGVLVFAALLLAANIAADWLLDAPGPLWEWPLRAIALADRDPDAAIRVLLAFALGAAAALAGAAATMALAQRRGEAIEGLHGTAHWADRGEIERAGLIGPRGRPGGVYVGAWTEKRRVRYLRHHGPEHVLAFAPTRSGKGVSLVLPTLLGWRGSVVVHDIKGEAWALTAGWRRQAGQTVLKFDPSSAGEETASFNPLEEVRIGTPREVGDAQNIAAIIADPDGKGLADHWSKTAHALLTGAILHCCHIVPRTRHRPARLADLLALFSDPDMDVEDMLADMLRADHDGRGNTHPVVAREARAMLNREGRERSSVLSTAVSYLTVYGDPVVARNTARSDFRIADLMNHERPVSLYLVVRPSDADRMRPLVRLIATQMLRRLTDRMDFEGGRSVACYRHRLLFMLDEFAQLRRLPAVEDALAFAAGFGIQFYLIAQDLQQIVREYGREEGLTGNCHIRVCFAPNKVETAELISRMSGQTTVVRKQTTVSGKRASLSMQQASVSIQEVQRPLITADEAMRLPAAKKDAKGGIVAPGHLLVFVAGVAPIYGRQILYFQDAVFSERAAIPAPDRSDALIGGRPPAGPPPEEAAADGAPGGDAA